MMVALEALIGLSAGQWEGARLLILYSLLHALIKPCVCFHGDDRDQRY